MLECKRQNEGDTRDSMFRKIKKISIFYRWVTSFLMMLITMLLASVGLFFYSYNIIESQEDTYMIASQIQYYMVITMILCLFIGLLIMYSLTKLKYNPMKELMDAYGYYDETEDQTEYEWLLQQKEAFQEMHKRAKQEISSPERVRRQQNLYRLLSLPYDSRFQKK